MKLAVLLFYVALLFAIGWISMRRTSSVDDFFLGGRTVGPWASAFAYGTTYFSSVLFIGYAGKVGWDFGLSSLWIVAGNAVVGGWLAWRVLGRRTREMTARLGAMTMPEFLEKRYDCRTMKIVAALVVFVFMVPYSASVYMGLSYFFEEIFNIPYAYALFFMAALTALYLVMGGYLAVAASSFVQGLVMIGGVLVMLWYVLRNPAVGGLAQVAPRLAAIKPGLAAAVGPPGWLPLFSLVVLTSLGPWGLPQMVQKFYSIKSERAIRPATVVTFGFALLMAFGAYFTGSLGRLFFSALPEGGYDVVMPQIIGQALPEAGGLLILLLVMSASMSTLASLVLVSSSSIAIDLVQGALAPQADRRHIMLLMRALCLAFIGFSLYLALTPSLILTLMAISWGTMAGAFLAPYLYGLFWQGATRAGAWAGMLSGLAISLGGWLTLPAGFVPTVGSAAMLAPLLVVPLVSAVTPRYSPAHLAGVFGMERGAGRE